MRERDTVTAAHTTDTQRSQDRHAAELRRLQAQIEVHFQEKEQRIKHTHELVRYSIMDNRIYRLYTIHYRL
jgi:hypothetical protein